MPLQVSARADEVQTPDLLPLSPTNDTPLALGRALELRYNSRNWVKGSESP